MGQEYKGLSDKELDILFHMYFDTKKPVPYVPIITPAAAINSYQCIIPLTRGTNLFLAPYSVDFRSWSCFIPGYVPGTTLYPVPATRAQSSTPPIHQYVWRYVWRINVYSSNTGIQRSCQHYDTRIIRYACTRDILYMMVHYFHRCLVPVQYFIGTKNEKGTSMYTTSYTMVLRSTC